MHRRVRTGHFKVSNPKVFGNFILKFLQIKGRGFSGFQANRSEAPKNFLKNVHKQNLKLEL